MASCAVVAIAFASGAEAKAKKVSKLRTASASAIVAGSGTAGSATATCPAKTKAVAGGFSTSAPQLPPAAPSHWLSINESQRVGERSWRVSGVQAFTGSDTLTAFVYCEANKAKVKTASKTIAIPTTVGLGSTAFATCPKGTKPLSGGFSLPPSSAGGVTYVSRSIAGNGVGWVVDATRVDGGGDARNLIAYAYCAKTGAIKTKSASAFVLGPVNSFVTAVTGNCAKKTSARGGGFATSTPVGGLAATALVYESRGTGQGWTSSASASGTATSSTLVSNAYCR